MLILAGTHSGCGKSTVTIGLLAALKRLGHDVQPFKAGPDFIDAGLHGMIASRPSRNLDIWMCGIDYVRQCAKAHAGADLAITEGVMGLFDGGERSTAALAGVLGANVVLVIDAGGMADSAGAIIKGFCEFNNGAGRIKGVIFNRVSSPSHFEKLRASCPAVDVSGHTVEILGYLPRSAEYSIPSRHLGLTLAEERPLGDGALNILAETVTRCIDLKKVCQLAETGSRAGRTGGPQASRHGSQNSDFIEEKIDTSVKVAVARDNAFCFYYEDNLDMLRLAGAEIVPFSPVSDQFLPEGIDAVYLGGGYPEVYARALSGNKGMTGAIKKWADAGRPVFAECGGFMYLGEGIRHEGEFFPLCGVFPVTTGILKETGGIKGGPSLGYREAVFSEDCMLGAKGERLRGHEFHYSQVLQSREKPGVRFNIMGEDKIKITSAACKATLAGYTHFHFGSNPHVAGNLVEFVRRSKKKKTGKEQVFLKNPWRS